MTRPDPSSAEPGRLGIGDLNATFCATVVDEWVRGGLTDAVVCPGSRSTPMALALAAEERLRVHVHHDERSGAFLALGLARALDRPVVVLTTSGTAAVELHPAVVEADLDRVPLVAVTADRPPASRSVGAAQTIDQTHLYGRSVRWFADPGPPEAADVGSWRSLAARALLEAGGPPAGPVQLNLPFREPLVGSPQPPPGGRPGGRPWHARPATAAVGSDQVEAVVQLLDGVARGVLVAGGGIGDANGVMALSEALGWPVLADPRSGCRRDGAVAHADALLRAGPLGDEVEAVIRLGSIPSSKVQARWMSRLDGPQVLVDRDGTWMDPDRTASAVIAAEPGSFARALARRLPSPRDRAWRERWLRVDAAVENALADAVDGHPELTEPAVARAVAAAVPPGGALVVSSSMPVRDLEWFAGHLPGVTVHANRGANGIDGVVSTAVGVALGGAPTVALLGDVALLHDTNGLLGLARRGVDLCLVVVDNDGGGIFSFLPQADLVPTAQFELLFGTPHGVDLAALARVHGLRPAVVDETTALGPVLAEALSAGGAHLLVARTDRRANVAAHDRLHRRTAEAVAAASC